MSPTRSGKSVAQRWRNRRRLAVAVLLVTLAGLVLADRAGLLLVRGGDDLSRYNGARVTVVRIVNAHTIDVDMADPGRGRPHTRVRLWGINAPLAAEGEPLGEEAAALTRRRVEGQQVTLRLEPDRTRDTFGRVLAHVELEEGGTLNEALLASGLAVTDERWPHALLRPYAQAQNAARRARRGEWSETP